MEAAVTTYAVIIERGETGSYGAYCPDLPGCVAVADDMDEVLELMVEAIGFHLEGLREHGEPIPHPSTVAATTVTVAA
ncbi:HicB family protein [Lentzea cavernae]|uniref:HicB family protein n=1 Tax=Lentzea cavernae TaxID=2020703 RepID=A0ABQ3MRX6_9PSEU|nr:HicB family protein [Lentzea cavernae]